MNRKSYLAVLLRIYSSRNATLLAVAVFWMLVKSFVEESSLRADAQYAASMTQVRTRWIPFVILSFELKFGPSSSPMWAIGMVCHCPIGSPSPGPCRLKVFNKCGLSGTSINNFRNQRPSLSFSHFECYDIKLLNAGIKDEGNPACGKPR
jgi:hypothetical protein